MSQFMFRSLYWKLFLSFFTIIFIVHLGLGLNFYFQTSEEIKEKAIFSVERLSDQSARVFESYMANIRTFAWQYFEDTEFQAFVPQMRVAPDKASYYHGKFNRFITENPIIGCVVVDDLIGPGLVVGGQSCYGNAGETRLFEEERERLHRLAVDYDGKGMWVTSKVYDEDMQHTVHTLTFVQALKSISLTERPIIGVLMIRLSVEEIQHWLQGVLSDEEGNFTLVDRPTGRIEISHNTALIGTPIVDRYEEGEWFRRSGAIVHEWLTDRGQPWLIVTKALPKTDWALVAKIPVNVMLEEVNELAKRTILLGFVSLAASLLLASLLSSKIVVPLKRLRDGMKQIELGKYDIALPVQTKDEIGYLSESFNKMVQEINRLFVQVYDSELKKKDAEIKALQSQINPHFLYNTLSTIDSLASIYDDARISTISRSLAKMFRYNISGGDLSTLEKEIEQIRQYLSIQKIRFGNRLEFTIDVEEGLEQAKIPKLLFQPLVENSIIHGIEKVPQGGAVRITAATVGENMEIRVWNSGKPIEAERAAEIQTWLRQWSASASQAEKPPSIGLMNIQSRIKLFYDGAYGLSLQSGEDEGTTFIITIAIQ